MKQRILIVDDKIRSIGQHDSDEKVLKSAAQFICRYRVALALLLVVVCQLPLYFTGYVFSLAVYRRICIAFIWATTAPQTQHLGYYYGKLIINPNDNMYSLLIDENTSLV
jgi:hypothetical protein